MVGRRVAYLTLFKAFVGCFEQANGVVLTDSTEGEEMKLRECDCGSEVIYIDPRDRYVVFCHTCDVCTVSYTKVDDALEAWNAGITEEIA